MSILQCILIKLRGKHTSIQLIWGFTCFPWIQEFCFSPVYCTVWPRVLLPLRIPRSHLYLTSLSFLFQERPLCQPPEAYEQTYFLWCLLQQTKGLDVSLWNPWEQGFTYSPSSECWTYGFEQCEWARIEIRVCLQGRGSEVKMHVYFIDITMWNFFYRLRARVWNFECKRTTGTLLYFLFAMVKIPWQRQPKGERPVLAHSSWIQSMVVGRERF